LRFKIKDTKLLKDLIAAVKILETEVTMRVNKGGILIRLMDPSRVAMVDLDITKAVFEEFECKDPLKIGFNLAELDKLLKRSGKDDATTIEFNSSTGKLQITITGKYTRVFTLPTLKASEEEVPTPKITFNSEIKFITDSLKQALEDAQLVSDHVKMTTVEDGLEIDATGDLMTAHAKLDKNSGSLLDVAVKEQSHAVYSLKYVMQIVTVAQVLADIGVLEFSTEMPVKLSFEKDAVIKLTYWVAPRIETE